MDVSTSVAFLLHDVARQFRHRFDYRTRVLGVTRPQWRALFHIARREGITQSELADALDIERITACRMVDRLSEAGLVERRSDPQDRRVWRLHLMPEAHPLVSKLNRVGAGIEEEALSVLSSAEREKLVEMLQRIRIGLQNGDRDGKGETTVAGDAA